MRFIFLNDILLQFFFLVTAQPIGQPEICKMSLRESTVNGNMELIMIGKNFMKGTKVFFQEITGEDGPVVWEKESEIDKDYFQPVFICPCHKS
jgi:nuclear factor of activated T-cells 5